MEERKYVCDRKFEGNELIVRQKVCGKTTFVQKLTINNLFGELKEVEWISKVKLSPFREAKTETCFSTNVRFHYPNNVSEFDNILSTLQKKQVLNKDIDSDSVENDNENKWGKIKMDKVIVMNDISGLADKLGEFSSFLTVLRNLDTSAFVYFIFYTRKKQTGE